MKVSPPPDLQGDQLDGLIRTVALGDWHKPVPKVSRADAKELPDVVLQLEQEREKNLQRDSRLQDKERK
jgi:hypothetical protein